MDEHDGKPMITRRYIQERRVQIHTYDSFGRALAEHILHRSEAIIGEKGSKEMVDFDARVEVKPVTRKVQTPDGPIVITVCLEVCIIIFGVPFCTHIGTSWPDEILTA